MGEEEGSGTATDGQRKGGGAGLAAATGDEATIPARTERTAAEGATAVEVCEEWVMRREGW